VASNETGDPIVFHAGDPDGDILSTDRRDLHTYGQTFKTRWVTIHDTDTDGYAPFDANAAAKAADGTPFKRPENGVFQPGTGFGSFYFTETGDTNLATEAGADHGGFGAVYRLTQSSPNADTGRLSMLIRGDAQHTGFDNISFLGKTLLAVVEDAGDSLHTARNALDSAYLLRTGADYSNATPVRFLAEGRDPSATIDSALGDADTPGFQNEGDNEITGIHTSDGDPSVHGVLGAKIPQPLQPGSEWRLFWTQQHGDNITWEVVRG
jgi:secreted PhoX family phosphatase